MVASKGPKTAELAFVGDFPDWAAVQANEPFVGRAGKPLHQALSRVAIDINSTRLMNMVPVRAPRDDWSKLDAAVRAAGQAKLEAELAEMPNLKLVVALGEEAWRFLSGLGAFHDWRGSLVRPGAWPAVASPISPAVPGIRTHSFGLLPTYHPEQIQTQYKWIWPFTEDISRAATYLRGDFVPPPAKQWFVNRYDLLPDFVDSIIDGTHLVALDSEMDPMFIVALATEWEVHTFAWSEKARAPLERLLTAPSVVKVAHNWNHDATFLRNLLGITPSGPFFDTMGGAHILDPEREKSLSPGISTRFTNWPFHKWMVNHDPLVYCGMDAACTIDSYWPIIEKLSEDQLLHVANHDHKLLRHLLEMQWEGIPVDEAERSKAEAELREQLNKAEDELREAVKPIVQSKIHKFEKPHLFLVDRKCNCCGGGKTQREHCWQCGGLPAKPERKADYAPLCAGGLCDLKRSTVSSLKQSLPACSTCNGSGKIEVWKPFNPESSDQLADVIYRGLGIKARRFKGKETTRVDRLQAIDNPPPLVTRIISVGQIRADYETVARLRPDLDGKLHCVFDPWGTVSGRVAGKEGLIGVGTNPMNIPKKARKMIVAPEGYGFMYPDQAQIEARAVAVLGNEEKLLEIYRSGGDSHTEIMNMIKARTGFDMNDVKVGSKAGEGRELTKRGVYAVMYGIRASHLAGELGLSLELAEEIISNIKRTLPGIASYQSGVIDELARTRMVRSKTGRIRKFNDRIYNDQKQQLKEGSLVQYEIVKKAWSFAPQDMAAWVLALGMFKLAAQAPWIKRHAHVHDALLLSYPLDRQDEAVEIATQALTMEMWGMIFPAGMSLGPNWYVASEKDSWKIANGYESWVRKAA